MYVSMKEGDKSYMFFNSISYAVDIQARSVIVWLTWICDSINGFVDVNREIQMSFITNLHEAHHMEFEDLNDHHTLQECKLYTQLTHRIYINEKNTRIFLTCVCVLCPVSVSCVLCSVFINCVLKYCFFMK